jgi:lipopolysaccharide transport system permease protein
MASMKEIWEYRGLIKKLAITDLKIRYKSSVLGILWSLLQPLMLFAVLLVVFTGLMLNQSIDHYSLYLLLGIIGWGFFDKATSFSLVSVMGKPQLVKKIYFPREVLVISACLTALIMSLIEFVVFGIIMIAFVVLGIGVLPTPGVILFPAILLVEFALALGVGLTLASLNVIWRDVQWIWPVVMQAGFFLTPVMYSMELFRGFGFAWVLNFNPMTAILDSLRYIFIGRQTPLVIYLGYAAAMAVIMLVIGWLIFNKLEPRFGEEV